MTGKEAGGDVLSRGKSNVTDTTDGSSVVTITN